jgi:hypothetical protein
MLQPLGPIIAEAYQHALDAEYEAATGATPTVRKEYEKLAQSWRTVAMCLEFTETLERSRLDRDRARDAKPREPPPVR